MESAGGALEQRVRDRDEAALAEFLELRRPQLCAYIENQLGPALRRKVEPDDLVQEVSLDCLRALPQIDLAGRDPFSWLCQVAQRRIIDAHRRFFGTQKRAAGRELPLGNSGDTQKAQLIDLLVASITSPSQAFSRDQRELRLLDALAKLPEESRQALQLRYAEQLPTKEIADRLGKSDGAIRVLLTRALKRLQEMLES